MNVKILLALLALVVGAVGGYVVLETRNDAEDAERSVGAEPPSAVPGETAEASREAETAAEPPTFELVRVEPTGDLVAAGLATPGSLVELLEGETVLAGTEATASGEWALVLDAPLAVGSHDLSLRATVEGGRPVYGDRVAIVVSGDGETPLVAVTSEGEPSRIVQRPEADQQVAAAETEQATEAEQAVETEQAPAPAAGAGQELATAPSPQDEADAPAETDEERTITAEAPAQPEAAEGEQLAADTPSEEDAPVEREGAEETVAAGSQPEPTAAAVDDTSADAAPDAAIAAAPAGEGPGEQQTAMVAPADGAPATAPSGARVAGGAPSDGPAPEDQTTEAEAAAGSDDGRPSEATEEVAPERPAAVGGLGSSENGGQAASDEPAPVGPPAAIGDEQPAETATGIAAAEWPTAEEDGGQQVADAAPGAREQVSAAGAPTADDPAGSAPSVAPDDRAAPGTAPETGGGAPGETDVAALARQEDPAPAAPSPSTGSSQAEPDVKIETVEVEEPGRLMMSGEASPDQPVRLYVNNEQVGEVVADATGNWFLTASRDMPPGRYEVRADAVDRSGGVSARSAVRFERVQVAFAGESGTSGGAASGSASVTSEAASVTGSGSASSRAGLGGAGDASVVMINRGDNLWTIARKLYGRGVRYTVIYDANRSQIRDPSLIYPGQVFTVPELLDELGVTDQPG